MALTRAVKEWSVATCCVQPESCVGDNSWIVRKSSFHKYKQKLSNINRISEH